MKRMLTELMRFKGMILLLFVSVIGSVGASLALPMYLSNVINTAIPNQDMGEIIAIGGIMLLFVLLGAACSIATGFFASLSTVGMGKNLRSLIFSQIQSFSQTEFDHFSASSLITRTNNDVMQVQTFMNILLRVALMAPIMCVGGLIMALGKSPKMSMVLLFSMPLMVIFILMVGKLAAPLSRQMQKKLDQINLVIREKLTGIRVARTFGTEQFEEERFNQVNSDFMKTSIQMNLIMTLMMPALTLILYGTMVAIIGFGGYQIIHHSAIPVGDIIAITQYVMQIMMSVLMLSMLFIMYPRAAVSAERINQVLNTTPIIAEPAVPAIANSKKGYLSFKNVSFTFPHANAPALENISFDSGPGEVTAIIGSTGCGKSTLINLIPRFYDVHSGEILVNGINIKDIELKTLRAKIGLVPQKAFLFKGTIADNVGYGLEDPAEEVIEHAIRVAQSYDFAMAKEGGLQAPITQGATNVSGGQKQRLAIARAIARKPEIYIFDDSFSALDFKTDAALRKALLAEAKAATVILVAQRVSTIKNADRILVLENGRCVGQGKHDDLLKSCQVYQEIVYSQLSQEEV
ncbi:ABC transporter ATP-binding protein [Clostridiales bacterium COT073_COT-073]|nr:ABC transporter ATP-binding protein [Clostridiales bacterium COT073_COT-073]